MANPACSNINPNGTYIDVRLGEEEYAQAAVKEAIKDASRPVAGDGSGSKKEWLKRAKRDYSSDGSVQPGADGEIRFEQGLVQA